MKKLMLHTVAIYCNIYEKENGTGGYISNVAACTLQLYFAIYD